MKVTQQFRNKIGFSQDEMAKYLSITRSQLTMYENNKRELPTQALLKIAKIELFFNQTQQQSALEISLLKTQQTLKKDFLMDCEKKIFLKLLSTQRALKKVQKKYQQNLALLQLAQHLQLPNYVVQQAIDDIENYGLLRQLQLELKIENYNQQATHIAKLMAVGS